jgi:hypothetical protein
VIAWVPDAVRPDLHHVIRATYYASAAGDEQRMGKLAEIIRTLQFRQYAPPGALHISSLLGNKMTSYILNALRIPFSGNIAPPGAGRASPS